MANKITFTALLLTVLMLSYKNSEAQSISITTDIPYRTVENSLSDKTRNLYLDIYEPSGHSDTLRPLVINVVGGAFVMANRNGEDMINFCTRFAKEGFVAATIDYRVMDVKNLTYSSIVRSGYQATQDLSYAIRFFKANWEKYRIDTTRISLLGQSAGAVAVFHTLFMDENQRPVETFQPTDLGMLRPTDTMKNFTSNVACAVCLWGCVMDSTIIDKNDRKTPVCLIHGRKDKVLPCNTGYSFSKRIFPYVYGSECIAKQLSNKGIPNELHVFENENHAFYYDLLYMYKFNKAKFDSCFQIALDFIRKNTQTSNRL